MAGQRGLRTLSEPEFNSIKDRLLAEAPEGLSERDLELWICPRLAAAVGEAEATPDAPQGSALGRFVSNAAEVLNPVAAVKGIASAVAHPVDTVTNIGRASLDQGRQAVEAAREGRNLEAVGHALGTIPLIGPAAVEAGEQIASGDIAGGMGRGMGLLVPAALPAGVRQTGRVLRTVAPEGVTSAVAGSLESGAAQRVADVMTPKVGPNKLRFGNTAADVAPAIAKDPTLAGGLSREALHGKVATRLEAATDALDAAADARLSARTFQTQPMIDALRAKIRALTSEAVEASSTTRPSGAPTTRTTMGVPGGGTPTTTTVTGRGTRLGQDVVPRPNQAHVAALEQAIKELEQLGPSVRYDTIRTMRMAYDQPARVKYNPSLTSDYLKNQAGANAAADITGVLRENLAKWDPQTAAANAEYSLFKNASDVLRAAEEVERARPTMFRKAMARVSGAAAGGGLGLLLAETSEVMASAGWTTKLKTAQAMSSLARALRAGDQGAIVSATHRLKRLGGQAATLTGTTNPSGSQTPATAPGR